MTFQLVCMMKHHRLSIADLTFIIPTITIILFENMNTIMSINIPIQNCHTIISTPRFSHCYVHHGASPYIPKLNVDNARYIPIQKLNSYAGDKSLTRI